MGSASWLGFAVLACAGGPPAQPPPTANDVTVDAEVARQRVLTAFGPSCTRGTEECEGAAASAPAATRRAPSGAAGFDLGMALDDAEKRCRAAGQLWFTARESSACSGSVGARLPYHVDLVGCHDFVCRLVLSEQVGPKALERFREVAHELVDNYGGEHREELEVPGDCRDTLARCLQDGRAKARAAWRWDDGHTLTVTLEAPTRDDVFVVLSYSSPAFGDLLRTRGL